MASRGLPGAMVNAAHRLLIVEDDPLFARTLRLQLGHGPFALTFCAHTAEALDVLCKEPFDLLLLDIHLGGHEEGLEALPKIIAAAPNVPVVVHSVLSDHATVVRAMRQGAYDYIPKHMGIKTLGAQLQGILSRHVAEAAAQNAPTPIERAPTATQDAPPMAMVGASDEMLGLRRAIVQATRSQGSVIIYGEPGSGKELVARALARRDAPFVAVDASTLEGNLATGLLFGHERGAFTGAETSRAGLFEQAHGGIFYVDEIANMPLDVQAKLLRVLQEREVVRLGGHRARALNFRLICATHADLADLCRRGQFRFDLLTRLQVFTLQVPPLRQRLEDVPELFALFVKRACEDNQQPLLQVSGDAVDHLMQQSWPGNVRELQNVAQYAVSACAGPVILRQHLPPWTCMGQAPRATEIAPKASCPSGPSEVEAPPQILPQTFHQQVRTFEVQTLRRAFANSQGNISALARTLGMDRSSLYAKLRQYGIYTRRQ